MLKYFSTCKVRDRNKATICLSISTIDTDDDIFDVVNSTMRSVYDISDFNINSCFSMKIRGELKYDDNEAASITVKFKSDWATELNA